MFLKHASNIRDRLDLYICPQHIGGVFSAINISAWQVNNFSPNISILAGYIFPFQPELNRVRIGLNYYNGRSLSNQFYNRKEKFTAFYVAVDF